MRCGKLLIGVAVALSAWLGLAPGRTGDGLTLTNLDGKTVRLTDVQGKKATVVVFLSFECPVSTSYVELLGALKSGREGLAVLGVCPTEDPADALRLAAREYRVAFPLYRDADRAVARRLKATVTPEAFLIDAEGKVRYRGRIDDDFASRGKRSPVVRSHDLRDAIDAVLAGKPVAVASTKAIGCPIVLDRPVVKEGKLTYHRDVRPILQKHCQVCHRKGEVGPFALATYRDAQRWADDIKEYTRSRKMPPWMPADGPGFQGERRLSPREIDVLSAWADAGAPEGDPKEAPPPAEFPDGWRMGKPDLVLSMKEAFHLSPNGKDLFRCFVLPTKLDEHQWIVGFDVRPGAPRVVHHTLHFYDLTGSARKLEQRAAEREKKAGGGDRGPGYTVAMGVGFVPPDYKNDEVPKFGGVGGWAPGQAAQKLPPGVGMFLPKGADFILQVHYHRDGKPASDRTEVGLYFAKKPVEQPWQTVIIPGMRTWEWILPGRARHVSRGAVYLHTDALLHDVMPHMHLLGKSVKVTMTLPGGKPQVLVDIPAWDYNWQETYWFKKPILAPAGTKLEVEGVFDNSAANPNNPFSPPRTVFFGEETTNEMLYAFLGATSTTKPWSMVDFSSSPPRVEKTESHARGVLGQRVGVWDTKTTCKKAQWTEKEATYTGTETVEWTLGKRFLECRDRTQPGGAESKLLATWDREQKDYRCWYFDSEGTTSEARGAYDVKTKVLTWTSKEGGIVTTSRWKFVSDDVFEWDMVTKDEAGSVLLDAYGKMTRKK